MRRFRQLLPLAPIAVLLMLASPAQAATHYTVRWGDTLTWIAQAHHISLQRLATANHLQPYGVLVEGTVLRIPGHRHGRRHHARHRRHHAGHHRRRAGHRITVHWGDTLSGIAARYGTTLTHLAEMNRLSPYGMLLAGATLRVPGHAHHAAARPVSTAGFNAPRSIDRWAAHYGVDPRLARAVAWMESGYHTGAVSSVGAWGVMQVMPQTWRYVEGLIGHPVARTPDGNVRIGVAYLHHLLNEFGGSRRLALAAYYQGPAGVRRFGVLPVSELYIADVLALRSRI